MNLNLQNINATWPIEINLNLPNVKVSFFFLFCKEFREGGRVQFRWSWRKSNYHLIIPFLLTRWKLLKGKAQCFLNLKKWLQQQNEFSTEFKSTEINKMKNVCPSFIYPWVENGNFDKKTSCCYCERILTVIKSSWKQKKKIKMKFVFAPIVNYANTITRPRLNEYCWIFPIIVFQQN